MLRRHQTELRQIAIDIRTGASESSRILAYVTPGGGKSGLPMILAKELAEPLGLRICWVVPRDALRAQGEQDFVALDKRALFGHKSKIRAAGNDTRPARDTIGYITTYQAIVQNPELHLEEFILRPYILVLDENHHIPDKGQGLDEEARYYSAIAPLVEKARYTLFMSGTLERHDGFKVAFIPYTVVSHAETPDLKNPPGWHTIRYTRKDALNDGAIVPLIFRVMDGRAKWLDSKTGDERQVESIATSPIKDQPAILQTVLETNYAHQLIERCVAAWQDYKSHVYPLAKMLVIAPSIEIAKGYYRHLSSMGLRPMIATSDDSESAKTSIKRFKNDIDVLVTVGMAYEGLDVPPISHVACLTNIRSKPWIEQALCRANRTTKDGNKTHGFIYYPDDPRMKSIIESIDAEQAAVILTWPDRGSKNSGGSGGSKTNPIAPLSSIVTGERGYGLEDGTHTDYNETNVIINAMRQAGIRGVSPVQFKQALVAIGAGVVPNGNNPQPDYSEDVLTPSETEKQLRKSIERQVSRIAQGDAEKIIDLRFELKKQFGSVTDAGAQTLQMILRYLAEHHGATL